jgi:peptide/nickel transport system substrate-binding protein
MFLRLADLGADLSTTNERSFQPRLARRWTRSDARTLVFELDPRAAWHDGVAVTARDVVFGMERARDGRISPQLATLLRRIESVTAESDHRVRVRFREAYAEQLYDATYHTPPLPAHLLAGIVPESLATAAFVAAPVGNGPYRFLRRSPGQQLELAANDRFFLGRPGVARIVFLLAADAETRVNLLRSGQVDAVENIYALPNWSRVEQLPGYHYHSVPGLVIQYVTFNFRDPADTTRPHPLFADRAVREALVLASDRQSMGRGAYGPLTTTPGAPISAILGRAIEAPPAPRFDTAAAARLLAQAGWRDSDGDSTLDKDGRPLAFRLMVPSVSAARVRMAVQMQETWRRLGARVEIDQVEPGLFLERRRAGRYDMESFGVSQDPTPAGLVQSWSCAGIGGANVGHYCNPEVDSLLARGGRRASESSRLWSKAVRQIADDVPALFQAALVAGVPVHRRFTRVTLRPESLWSAVWQWQLRPGQALERDRP